MDTRERKQDYYVQSVKHSAEATRDWIAHNPIAYDLIYDECIKQYQKDGHSVMIRPIISQFDESTFPQSTQFRMDVFCGYISRYIEADAERRGDRIQMRVHRSDLFDRFDLSPVPDPKALDKKLKQLMSEPQVIKAIPAQGEAPSIVKETEPVESRKEGWLKRFAHWIW